MAGAIGRFIMRDRRTGTYAYMHSLVRMKRGRENSSGAGSRYDAKRVVRGIMAQSTSARCARSRSRFNSKDAAGQVSYSAQARATADLESRLTGPLPRFFDAGPYLTRVASLQQTACDAIGVLSTSVDTLRTTAFRARVLAFMQTEVIEYLASCLAPAGSLIVYLAIGKRGSDIVFGAAVRGDWRPVGSLHGHQGLLRAAALVDAMGGSCERGIDGDRMVIGITMPINSESGWYRATGPIA